MTLLVVTVAAFAIAFAVARGLAGGGSDDGGSQPAPRSHAPVAIDNLERMPEIKPLRSAPGAPPPADTAVGASTVSP